MGPIQVERPQEAEIRVRLPAALSRFVLPSPPSGPDLVRAIQASLLFLEVAPDQVTLPLYAATWRAAITGADFSLHVTGPTGAGKSELTALAQQHYGAGLDARNLPGAWASTANALEGTAYRAKDALLVVDDFVPQGSQSDVDRAHRDADRLFRGQGNNSGRARCNRDGTPKEGKSPRGLIFSSGEESPRGHSLNARILNLDLAQAAVRWEQVTICQNDARAGLYAQAMAGFIRWMAPRYDEVREVLRSERERLREEYRADCQHLRTASIAADLQAGFEFFLEFAVEKGAISQEQSDALLARLGEALGKLLKEQGRQQGANDPVTWFLELLGAALLSGWAHVADPAGGPPENRPEAWGWEVRTSWEKRQESTTDDDRGDDLEERTTKWPKGDRIGWLVGGQLYLIPGAALASAQRVARNTGQHLPLTDRTLGKRLHQRGLLASRDENRGKYTVRLNAQRARPDVLHLSAESVIRPPFYLAAWAEPDYEGPPLSLDDLLA
jgi:hypothetical protein